MAFAWTDEAVAELLRMLKAKTLHSDIAAELGCTKSAVSAKASRLVAAEKKALADALAPKPPRMTPEEERVLRLQWAEGIVAAEIGKPFGWTSRMVHIRARELNLPRRGTGPRAKAERSAITTALIAEAHALRVEAEEQRAAVLAGDALAAERREAGKARALGNGALPPGHAITWGLISPHREFQPGA